jgi:hypothetical protein
VAAGTVAEVDLTAAGAADFMVVEAEEVFTGAEAAPTVEVAAAPIEEAVAMRRGVERTVQGPAARMA